MIFKNNISALLKKERIVHAEQFLPEGNAWTKGTWKGGRSLKKHEPAIPAEVFIPQSRNTRQQRQAWDGCNKIFSSLASYRMHAKQ